MRRRHRMPFGADCDDDETRVRLWAPSAQRVDLRLGSGGDATELAMKPTGAGWFGLTLPGLHAGRRYAFRIDGGLVVPDPASRCNPDDVHGAGEIVDPAAFAWSDDDWCGRPWHEAAIYELHVGAFTPAGTFAGVMERLDYLADLGVTAIELMPVADFPGRRNWGYDGVLPFAPASRYGRPEDLKALVQAAHARGLMMLLDVVYNHFGPEGNYLRAYAAPFFTDRHKTPWGDAIAFDGPEGRTVRDFFVHNALYWIEEFRFDGLRLDAVHAIADAARQRLLLDIAEAVRNGPGRERHVHLVLENDANEARYLRHAPDAAKLYDAQWNDDFHHAAHVLLTGEKDGYYGDYADAPAAHLERCLGAGFDWQGAPSPYRDGAARGEATAGLPPTAFVAFLQNHDQVGNRAHGERLSELAPPHALDAAQALLLLAPFPPLMFMGEEYAAAQPFLFFCDFAGELAEAVTRGRRGEFARFAQFRDPAQRERIPDPNADDTFRRSCLDWSDLERPQHAARLERTRQLLRLRRRLVAPRLAGIPGDPPQCSRLGPRGIAARWTLGDGARLAVLANFGDAGIAGIAIPPGRIVDAAPPAAESALAAGALPAWSTVWLLDETDAPP